MIAVAVAVALISGQPSPEPWQRTTDERGAPASEGLLIDGLLEGPWVSWHPTGFMADLGQYRHQRETGLWRSWDDLGRLALEGEWRNGQPDGTWRYFHPSGGVASEGSFVDGQRQGPWAERFADGTLFRVTWWENGEAPRGAAESECVDAGLEWHVDLGERREGCLDEEGRRTGLWRGFHPNGSVAWERSYEAGLATGAALDYHPDGALLHEGELAADAPIGLHVWTDRDGSILGVSDLGEGDGWWRDYWPDGRVKEDGGWVEGQKDGLWRGWDEHGQLVAEVVWAAGQRVSGRFVASGLVIEGDYVAGRRHGVWTARDGDGKRVWQGEYESGERTGPWLIARVDASGAAGADALAPTFAGDWETGHTAWWPNGAVRETLDLDARQCFWPDGTLVRADALADGTLVVDPDDDPDTTWLRAEELQAWLLADPPLSEALMATTLAPDDERAGSRPPVAHLPSGPTPHEPELVVGPTNAEGLPDGLWTYLYETGARREQGSFAAGVRQGMWRGWDRDEHPIWEGSFLDDKPDGRWRAFHRDGSVLVEGRYERGVRVGTWIWYHPGGVPSQIGDYKDGQPDGLWRGFHPSGLLSRSGAYAVGRRVGTWIFWRPDGREQRRASYDENGRELR
ncbi:MAG: hypothetical protein U1F43_19180 [Myxococcota bacterium]